ncbi:DUF72 domain-containing protein, partial [Xanthomonas oryzae]
ISHDARLHSTGPLLDAFLAQVGALGTRLGWLLLQLPPSAVFDAAVAAGLLAMLRRRWAGGVVCAPRHASWFAAPAQALLERHRIARCAADPAPLPAAAIPRPVAAPLYRRWHDAPRIYYRSYDDTTLQALAAAVRAGPPSSAQPLAECWVIFDNSAAGCATSDALELQRLLGIERKRQRG